MKKILFLLYLMIGSAFAETTGSLTSPWSGVVTGSHPNNCCSGGPQPLYDPNTGIVHFSYGTYTIQQTIAINNALSGSGIQIGGYNYQYDLRNLNGNIGNQNGVDSISVNTYMTDGTGLVVGSSSVTHNTPFDWQTFNGTVNLASELSLVSAGHMGIQFTSRDAGFWAGYYGPQVRNVSMSINYTVDQCSADPLSSTSCPGYEAAYLSAQCSANPLYSSSCPGYQQAFYTQQCTINPLYDSGCPGYQQAYYNQQCNANPLYDTGCPGYQQAYYDQQCSLDPLYDSGCTGYQQAFLNLQCSLNPLYDSQCPGYASAYFSQQCNLDGLYDQQCPNYAEAYAKNSLLSQSTTSVPASKEPEVAISSDGKVSTSVKLVEDDNVNKVLTETATSASPSPTSTVQLAPQGGTNANTKTEPSQSTAKAETKPATSSVQNRRQQAAARAQQQAQQQAKESLEQAANATSMEAQVAAQANVVAAMGFVPGFSAYQNVVVPDTLSRELSRQYNKPVIDNVRAQRRLSGASERLHQEMVDEQYR